MSGLDDFMKALGRATAEPSALLNLARRRITELEAQLVHKDLDIDRIKRKAQYVADLAYNKGIMDAKFSVDDDFYWEGIVGLLKKPRHEAEFKNK